MAKKGLENFTDKVAKDLIKKQSIRDEQRKIREEYLENKCNINRRIYKKRHTRCSKRAFSTIYKANRIKFKKTNFTWKNI